MRIDNQIIKTQLIEGKYPDITNILLPRERDFNLQIENRTLNEVVECAVFKDDNSYLISLEFKDNNLIIENSNAQLGEYQEVLENVDYKGDNFRVSLSGEYLKQALKTIKTEYVFISFDENQPNGKPIIIEEIGDNLGHELSQVVMPVRLS
jgi:DNA polymerase III sliding clamp (beta) subunit (PCNA family)